LPADVRQQLVKNLENARQMLNAGLAELDARLEIYPGWTKRQLQAHLSGWDEACIAMLRSHLEGKTIPVVDEPDIMVYINTYNAQSVARRKKLTDAEITAEFHRLRQEFITLIREMSEEKFHQPFTFYWGEQGTVADMTPIFVEHEIEHAHDLRKLNPGGAP
jgi:hypothetical protein